MKAIVLDKAEGFDHLKLVEREGPSPGPGEVLVRLRAASLNYRDLLIARGGYGRRRQKHENLVPLSDGAGEVLATGPGVARFKPGDRVLGAFFQNWIAGAASLEAINSDLGRFHDGVLCERRVFKEAGLARAPAHLSEVEAACLPCAALTAWSAVVIYGAAKPGDRVLVQGSGGVALFALAFAKLAGAEVIALSSSDEKLARLRAMGADHGINYRTDPEWGRTVEDLTGGRGVDQVVELAGGESFKQSLRAIRPGGTISLIGVLAGSRIELLIPLVGSRNVRLQGVTVGSRESLEAMVRAMEQHGIKPVVDRVFPLTGARAAYEHLESGAHFGKVCVSI